MKPEKKLIYQSLRLASSRYSSNTNQEGATDSQCHYLAELYYKKLEEADYDHIFGSSYALSKVGASSDIDTLKNM